MDILLLLHLLARVEHPEVDGGYLATWRVWRLCRACELLDRDFHILRADSVRSSIVWKGWDWVQA